MATDPNLASVGQSPRRPPHLGRAMALGASTAYLVGALLVVSVDNRMITGSRTDPFVFLFGLPALASVPGGVVGAISALIRYADDEDAPVRVTPAGDVVFDRRSLSAAEEEADMHAATTPAGMRRRSLGQRRGHRRQPRVNVRRFQAHRRTGLHGRAPRGRI